MIDDSTFTVCTVEGKHSDLESLRDRRDLPPPPGPDARFIMASDSRSSEMKHAAGDGSGQGAKQV